jgi:hypothetical protein
MKIFTSLSLTSNNNCGFSFPVKSGSHTGVGSSKSELICLIRVFLSRIFANSCNLR